MKIRFASHCHTLSTLIGLFVLSTAVIAAEPLTGTEIETLIGGNTVEGSMLETGEYSEYYGADGLIRGEGYSGTWFVENDTMCFQYSDEDPTCYGLNADDNAVQWLLNGNVDGTGTVVPGNPNDY